MGWEDAQEGGEGGLLREEGGEEGKFQKRRGRLVEVEKRSYSASPDILQSSQGNQATFLNLIIMLICRKLAKCTDMPRSE